MQARACDPWLRRLKLPRKHDERGNKPNLSPNANAGARVRVLAGVFNGVHGVIDDPLTDLHYLDVSLEPGAAFSLPLAAALRAFVYVFEGEASIATQRLPQHSLSVLGSGNQVELAAGAAGARLILVAGRPIGEPVVQYGPFVMNTREEVEQAMRDYRDGTLVRRKAA